MATARQNHIRRSLTPHFEAMESRALLSAITVPGTADPYQADSTNPVGIEYLTDGTTPPNVPVTAGSVLTFDVSGQAQYEPLPYLQVTSPDGGETQEAYYGSQGEISSWDLPLAALAGVFLSDTHLSKAPDPYEASLSASTYSPQLGQVFFIGDGLTGTGKGSRQTFQVPNGATKLYLVSIDAYEWKGNPGAYSVTVNQTMIDPSIHRQLYRSQSLSVPLVLDNQIVSPGANTVDLKYFLATNDNQNLSGDDGNDYYLGIVDNEKLNGSTNSTTSIDADITIPNNLPTGNYYLKVEVIPNSSNPSTTVVVSPALTEPDDTNGFFAPNAKNNASTRKDAYELAVGLAKEHPNYLIPEMHDYVKANEGFVDGPYLDSENIPTIGWGFALQDRVTTTVNGVSVTKLVDDQSAMDNFIVLNNILKSINKVGVEYPPNYPDKSLRGKPISFDGLVQLASLNGQTDSPTYEIEDFDENTATDWFNSDYLAAEDNVREALSDDPTSYDALPYNVNVVLVDMSYNIGPGFSFGSNAFNSMLEFIEEGNYPAAGLELMNSDYAANFYDLGSLRATINFRLLVEGYESKL